MTRPQKPSLVNGDFVEIKSQFGAEFRRVSIARFPPPRLDDLRSLLLRLHGLGAMVHDGGSNSMRTSAQAGGRSRGAVGEMAVSYTVSDGSLLPITNCHNFAKALAASAPLLRITVAITDDAHHHPAIGTPAPAKRGVFSGLRGRDCPPRGSRPPVGPPRDFHPLSSLIDVDVLPSTLRRVRLYRHGAARPLGFYVSDLPSYGAGPRARPASSGGGGGGVFISRLLPGGLAASSGLLAVGDRVLEVNGAPVAGKGLDEVTAMMVANGRHLVVTVRPASARRMDGGGGDGDPCEPDSGSSESSVQSLASDGSEGMRLSRRGSERRRNRQSHRQQQQQKRRNGIPEETSPNSRGSDSDSLALAPLLSDAELWDSEEADDDEDLVIDRTGSQAAPAGEPGRPARGEPGARASLAPRRRSGTVTREGGVITLYL